MGSGLADHLTVTLPWYGILVLVALLAWRVRSLTPRGAVAAGVVGALVLAGTGWRGGAVLLVFFVTSSGVSRLVRPRVAAVGDAKGDRRDGWQVMANGGAAAIGAMGEWLQPGIGPWIVTCSLAAAAADTWATAFGGLSRAPPRLLLSGAAVPPGTNGGVTWPGSLGGAAGSLVVAACGALLVGGPALLIAATAVGVAGMLLDSLLGERWQGRFHCPACLEPSERRVHRCGIPTVATGGVPWLSNDGVNALCTVAAAAAGVIAWRWLG